MSIPSTMKAWRLDAYNQDPAKAIAALRFDENVATPSDIGDDQVLIKVSYASVNPIDWKLFTGGFHDTAPVVFPYTPGFDVGGVVVKAGSKVANYGLSVGDQVIADIGLVESCTDPAPKPNGNAGAFAEYAAVDASICVKYAGDLKDATGLPLAGLTAYQALHTGDAKSFTGQALGSVKEGSKVLVLGGSGGVGTLAIQIAKFAKCHVACTSSKADLCKSLGADQVINYKTEDWAEVLAGKDYDLIFDCTGEMEDLTIRAPKVLKSGGDFVSIAQFDPSAKAPDGVRFSLFLLKSSAKDLQAMVDMMNAGALKVIVDSVYDLKDGNKALEQNLGGRTGGKILIKM